MSIVTKRVTMSAKAWRALNAVLNQHPFVEADNKDVLPEEVFEAIDALAEAETIAVTESTSV